MILLASGILFIRPLLKKDKQKQKEEKKPLSA
jgi:hypothetical protein